jgi:arabinofuranan 3-O-arabinosyltransferase
MPRGVRRGIDALAHLPDSRNGKIALAAATIAAWAGALWSWALLYVNHLHGRGLGYDLLFAWRAEKLWAAGGQPYSIAAFVYPPSSLMLFRPLGFLSHRGLQVGGLVATIVLIWLGVMISAAALGRRWWGLTAAVATLVLSLTGAARLEVPLENVSALEFAALALFLLLALREQWLAAAIVLGLSIAVKPMLLPVILLLLLARRWLPLAVSLGVPAVLNLIALALVPAPMQVLHKLPGLLNRSGAVAAYNSAWVDVARSFGLPEGPTILLRLFSLAAALAAAWWAWRRLEDRRLRLVTSVSMLLIGQYLAGTLSEYHYMLTLVPLAMTVAIPGSPMRFPLAWLGAAWSLQVLTLPRSVLGLEENANDSAMRAIGMSVLVITVGGVLLLRRRRAAAPAHEARSVSSGGGAAHALAFSSGEVAT